MINPLLSFACSFPLCWLQLGTSEQKLVFVNAVSHFDGSSAKLFLFVLLLIMFHLCILNMFA